MVLLNKIYPLILMLSLLACNKNVSELGIPGDEPGVQGNVFNFAGFPDICGGVGNGCGSSDGVGDEARFSLPKGITTDGKYLYIADYDNQTIRRIEIFTKKVITIAGTAQISGSNDGEGSSAQFFGPTDLTLSNNSLFVTDNSNKTIRKIDLSTNLFTVSTIAGDVQSFDAARDGIGGDARFNNPIAITSDESNLYITDNNAIRKIEISTNTVTTIAGLLGLQKDTQCEYPKVNTCDGNDKTARFKDPAGLTISNNILYISDSSNETIRKYDLFQNTIVTIAGALGDPTPFDDVGILAGFSFPKGITIFKNNLYITDHWTVRMMDLDTKMVVTLAGSFEQSISPGFREGFRSEARFYSPTGIAVDPSGNALYVTDTNTHSIAVIR